MEAWAIILILFAIIIIAFVTFVTIWVKFVCKALKTLKGKISAVFSEIEQNLKKKYEFLTNFFDFLKNFIKDDILSEAIKLVEVCNNSEIDANNEFQLNQIDAGLEEVCSNNAKLQENEEYLELKNQKQQIETEASKKIETYNNLVKEYNEKVQNFPSNFIARKFNYEIAKYFKEEKVVKKPQ